MRTDDTISEPELQQQIDALESAGVVFRGELPEHTSMRGGVKQWKIDTIAPWLAVSCRLAGISYTVGDRSYR